jgi:nitrate reductase gamma subunit
MINFIEGPLWTFSLVAFCVGVIWRLFSIVRLGVRADRAPVKSSGTVGGFKGIFSRSIPRRETLNASPLVIIAGYMFHIGLLLVMFWAAPHVRFLENELLGFGWTAIPSWLFILAAAIAFIGLIMLIIRRLVDPVLQKISTVDDHMGAMITFMVMLTGCLALQESWAGLRAFHMLWVEILMVYFPFSRLMHAFTFTFSRAYSGAMFGRRGIGT